MAACGMCSKLGKKLHKRWYNSYKIYICTKCAVDKEEMFDKELVNGN